MQNSNARIVVIFPLLLVLLGGLFFLSSVVYRPDRYGLEGKYFDNMEWQGLPLIVSLDTDISNLSSETFSETFKIYRQTVSENRYSVEWTGYIDIETTDIYTFVTESDDGSWVFIDDKLVVDNGGIHGLMKQEGNVHLQRGIHRITIRYLQTGGYAVLRMFWKRGEQSEKPLSNAYLLPPDTHWSYRIARNYLPVITFFLVSFILLSGYVFLISLAKWMGTRNSAILLIACGILLSLLCARVGKHFIEYTIIGLDGTILTPFLKFGLILVYCLIPLALLVFFVANSKMKRVVYDNSRFAAHWSLMPPPSLKTLLPLLIIALGMNGFLFIHHLNFGVDAMTYIFPVHEFMLGQGYNSIVPPGYGTFCYIFFLITRDFEISVMLAASFSYVFAIVIAYHIGNLFGRRFAGFLSAFFITFCPLMVQYSFVNSITMCYIFVALLSFFAYLNVLMHKADYVQSIFLGATLGYTVFTREEGFVLVVGGFFLLFLLAIITAKREKPLTCSRVWKRHLSYPTTALLITGVFLFIQMYPVYSKTGNWVLSGRLYTWMTGKPYSFHTSDQKEVTLLGLPGKTAKEQLDSQETPTGGVLSTVSEKLDAAKQLIANANKPFSLQAFLSDTSLSIHRLVHIGFYALIPLILVICSILPYCCFFLFRQRKHLFTRKIDRRFIFILGTFLIFLSPIIGSILFNSGHIRYVLLHSAPFLILIALIIASLVTFVLKKYALYGVLAICVISFLLVLGALNESILFKNRFLSAGFTLTKQSLHNLDESMPGETLDKLKPIKWKTFESLPEFWTAVEEQIGREWVELRKEQILREALISPLATYTTLPDAFTWYSIYDGLRAAGLWLAHFYAGDLNRITVMARRGPLVLFYATGKDEIPQGRVVGLPHRFPEVIETMTREQVDFLIFDTVLIHEHEHLLPLWENPQSAEEFGLKVVHLDPDGLFQIYSL